ncbi:hypothetical protein FRB96_002782 [Tulasnella sp. 330]|nr:hypothetical protein FRB96_002782 [Tulasnella sp. 330]KAG8872636.1 hypothetical protein FRB97_007481 [Tulasnella sp. 331]KAG8884600.1 hypothetical protein FRB98_002314 [Tulasnella sp. 332]
MSYSLALANPATPENIPLASDVISAASTLIKSDPATAWKKGKVFSISANGKVAPVRTFSKKVGVSGETWFMRVSEHDAQDGSFDEFWGGIGVDHAVHESQYIPEIVNASMLKTVEPEVSEVWSLHYNFGALLSPRTFTVLLITNPPSYSVSTPLREGLVVSIPFDTSSDKDLRKLEGQWGENGKGGGVGTKGRYAAVEWIRELADGKIEWRMATTSEPGGLIPGFLAAGAVPKAISKDVKHFLEWMTERRKMQTGGQMSEPVANAVNVPNAKPAAPKVIIETPGGSIVQPQSVESTAPRLLSEV